MEAAKAMSTSPGNLESRVSKLEVARKDLEDAMVVVSHLEKRMSEAMKDHAVYIAEHERQLRWLDERDKQQRDRNREVDDRIEKLVSAIGAMISQRPQ